MSPIASGPVCPPATSKRPNVPVRTIGAASASIPWLSFHALPPLDELLANRTNDALIALIREMLDREPDWVQLLELPSPPDHHTPLDLTPYRQQVDLALRLPNAGRTARELRVLRQVADHWQDGGAWPNAGALYPLILSKTVADYEEDIVARELEESAAMPRMRTGPPPPSAAALNRRQ